MVAWASRMFDLGGSDFQACGRSKWSPALPAAGPEGAGVPFEAIGPTPESGAAGGAASLAAAGAGAWAVWEEVDSGWPPQAARPKRRSGSRAARRVIVRVLVEFRERITTRLRARMG